MENRTPDLRVANATLYQLSYDPITLISLICSNVCSNVVRVYNSYEDLNKQLGVNAANKRC